jgi:hypothetical protein
VGLKPVFVTLCNIDASCRGQRYVVTGVRYETVEDEGNRFEIEQRFERLQREKGGRGVWRERWKHGREIKLRHENEIIKS